MQVNINGTPVALDSLTSDQLMTIHHEAWRRVYAGDRVTLHLRIANATDRMWRARPENAAAQLPDSAADDDLVTVTIKAAI